MRAEDLVRGVVRIWSDGEGSEIVGTGVLVAPDLVLTCAHVAARAWGTDPTADGGLGRRVRLDLPATAPLQFVEATVIHWLPRRPAPGGAYDLAGLRLDNQLPTGAKSLPLVVEEAPWGRSCRAFGFPAGRPDGSYASGELRDVLANGWMLVKGGAEAREFTRPGYSGGPVVTDAGVVGLLTEGDRDVLVREAVMVPVRTILSSWPELHRVLSRSPYPGLAPFTSADAAFFHGRDALAEEVADELAVPPHLVVLAGPSGSGKSSLLAAGVLPRLAVAEPDVASRWWTITWTPGKAPYPALARALLLAQTPDAEDLRLSVEAARLSRDLDTGRVTLADVLAQDAHGRWIVAVDQPEDLLIENGDAATFASPSARVFDAILAAQADERLTGRLAVIVAVRTDDLDALLRIPRLASRSGGDVVRYLGAVDDLRDVIEGPLRQAGFAGLEPGLTDRLLADVAEVPNPLPLLQFTLAGLWRNQRAGRLTHAAYDELGGVRRALANHAERTVAGFDDRELAAARDVLLQLGRPGLGDTVARRVARFDELGEQGRVVVDRLADARLLVIDRGADGMEQVEVAHEALFEHWPRLRSWWQESAPFRRWQESLRFALRVWTEGGEHQADLLQGPRLRMAEAYLRDRPGAFTRAELAFVMRSGERELEESEIATRAMRRELRLRQRLNVLFGAGLLAAAVLAAVAVWQTSSVVRLRADAERLLHATHEANAALGNLAVELEESLGESRVVLARRLGIEAVAMATAPTTFGGDMRLAALMASHAVRLDPSPASYDHLLRVVQAHPTYLATLTTEATAVTLAPDGRTVVVGDAEGGLQRWDGFTGARLGGRVAAHPGPVTALAHSSDGLWLLSGGAEGSVSLWDADSMRRRAILLDEAAASVTAVAVSTDGAAWIATDLAGTVWSWDAGDPSESTVLPGESLNSPLLAVGALPSAGLQRDQGITVSARAIDGSDSAASAAAAHASWAAHLAMHPFRPLMALPRQGRITVLDVRNLEELWSVPMPADDLGGLAFSSDGADLVVARFDGLLQAWDVESSGLTMRTWASRVADLRSVAAGVDPGRLLLALGDGSARWVDFREETVLEPRLRGHDQPLTKVLVGPTLAATLSREGRLVTWEAEPRQALAEELDVRVLETRAMALNAEADQLYIGHHDGALTRLSLTDASIEAHLPQAHTGEVHALAIAGGTLATVGRDGRLVARDPMSLQALATLFEHRASLFRVLRHPVEEAWLVGGVLSLVVQVPWDGGGITTLRPAERAVWSPGVTVAVTSDGLTMAFAMEPEVELWRDGSLLGRTRQLEDRNITQLQFDATGERLLGGGSDRATLWAVPSLEVIASWSGVRFAMLSPDGSLMVLVSTESEIRLLDAQTLAPIGLPLRGQGDAIAAMQFTADGSSLLTVDGRGTITRWLTSVRGWMDLACSMAWRDLSGPEAAQLLGDYDFEPVCEAS